MKIIVVISQSVSGVERRDFEEELIAHLLMETDGIEVTVIPDLEHLEDDTTGLLCLEGIKGDLIFASWNDPPTAFGKLAEKSIVGRFGRTSQSPSIPENFASIIGTSSTGEPLQPGVYDAMQRRIYCLDLNGFPQLGPLCEEIERIADENSTKTVSLIDLGGAEVTSSPAESAGEFAGDDARPAPQPRSEPKPASTPRRQKLQRNLDSPAAQTRESLIEEFETDADEQALDDLVDQLDDLDI